MTVPSLSIIFMAVSAVISIGLPIALLIIAVKRFGGKITPALVGAVAFAVFALGLESILHTVILLRPGSVVAATPWLFIVYATLAAGVFEETARFIAFHILKKRYSGIENALCYGVGHGGIEAIVLSGIAMISNIVVSLSLNSGGISALGGLIPPQQFGSVVASLSGTPSYMFLFSGIERVFAIFLHIALSVTVYYSVVQKRWYLYPLAMVMHAAANIPAAMMQMGLITDVTAVEVLIAFTSALYCAIAYLLYKKFDGGAIGHAQTG